MSIEDIQERLRRERNNARAQQRQPQIRVLRDLDLQEPNLKDLSLIKDWLPRGVLALIYGPKNCGKTFLTLDIALHVATGMPWHGHRVEQGRVVYIAAEAGDTIKNRVVAWRRKNWPGKPLPEFEAVVSPVDLCHPDEGYLDALINVIGGPVALVVVDTVSRALAGGDENAPKDMGVFVHALDQLRERLHCTVLAVHHSGKDESRGARGHTNLPYATDTIIEVQKRVTNISVAVLRNQRDGPAGLEFAFTLPQVHLGENEYHEPVTTCVVAGQEWVPEQEKPERLPKYAQMAKQALERAIAEKGQAFFLGAGIEGERVQVDTWRKYMRASGQWKDDDDDAYFRSCWKRGHERCLQAGVAEIEGDWAWMPGLGTPM